MRRAGVAELAIDSFRHYYLELVEGATGLLPDAELEPVSDVPNLDELPSEGAGAPDVLDRAVIVKLNGGLGTSMGMTRAKSLIEAKAGLSFLDVLARQTLALRRRHGARLPLVLMNSFYTRDDSLAALERHADLRADVPLDFLQNREPKIRADNLQPVSWPDDPSLEWCPPGHGDVYTALLASGMLDTLLDRGYEFAFVSNSDNLGALLEPRILAFLAAERIPFLMECVIGTEAERKGGHLARHANGRLVLRETAQVPEEDEASFRDYRRWRYYNTNNLWLDLRALRETLASRGNVLGLPLIVNRKTVDPSDSSTPEVLQLETAMGAAIGVFDGARVVCVPRTRFAPVKTTNDLLVLRSDAYVLDEDGHVRPAAERRDGPPYAELDSRYYKRIDDFEARFPSGPPSLVACRRLVVHGDVTFGAGVRAVGDVEVAAGDGRTQIPDGAVLEG